MSDKATPRPWVVNGFGGDFIVLAQLRPLGVCVSAYNPDRPVDEIENARLIVSAVNAYEAHQRVAQALREAVLAKERELDGFRQALGRDPLVKCVWYDSARAALAELDKVAQS